MLSLTKKNLVGLLGITSATLMGMVAGCSGDDSSGVTPGDDSGTVGNDGSSGDGSGGDGSTSDGGSDGGGPTSIKSGNVTYQQSTIAGPVYSTVATAYFYEAPAGYDADCVGFSTVATPAAAEASCSIKVCSNPISPDAGSDVDAGDAGPIVFPSSGDITLKTAVDTAGTVLVANSDGTYTPVTGTAKLWDPNDATGEVKSNGSTTSIASFDDTGLVTPGNVTTPKLGDTDVSAPATSTTTFDRGTALAVTYSAGVANTKLTVRLTTTSTAKKAIINCNFDASNGTQSIASADLENLEQAGTTGVSGAYSVQARTIKPTTVSDFTFDVILAANAYNGTFTNSN